MEQAQKTILLAEDDNFVGRAYKDGLLRAGWRVITAMDGNEAVKKAKNLEPDLILLDLVMPAKSGFEVLEELRADNAFKDIPIIVLSNLSQETDVEKAMQAGATDFLIKNQLSMKQVIERIRQYLR